MKSNREARFGGGTDWQEGLRALQHSTVGARGRMATVSPPGIQSAPVSSGIKDEPGSEHRVLQCPEEPPPAQPLMPVTAAASPLLSCNDDRHLSPVSPARMAAPPGRRGRRRLPL